MTFGTTTVDDREKTRASWNKADVIFSIILIVVIVAAYLYFTG